MGDVLAVQNTRIEGMGVLGRLLEQDGFAIDSVYAKREALPELQHSLVVILGAPESANDSSAYLRAEQDLIRRCVSAGTPVLGICLGSQMIAKAFGARVYRGPEREIGFYDDLEPTANSKLFAGFARPFTVFHWHGDTFDLPAGAVRLARSKNYRNQAFQIGSAVGLQFHLEVDAGMVDLWLGNAREDLMRVHRIDPDVIRSQVSERISLVSVNLELFYRNFKSEFKL